MTTYSTLSYDAILRSVTDRLLQILSAKLCVTLEVDYFRDGLCMIKVLVSILVKAMQLSTSPA